MPSDESSSLADVASVSRDTIFCGLLCLLGAASIFFLAGDPSGWTTATGAEPGERERWLFAALVTTLAVFGLLECLFGYALVRCWPGSSHAVLALACVIAAVVIISAARMIYRLGQAEFSSLLTDLLFLSLFGGYAWQTIARLMPRRNSASA